MLSRVEGRKLWICSARDKKIIASASMKDSAAAGIVVIVLNLARIAHRTNNANCTNAKPHVIT